MALAVVIVMVEAEGAKVVSVVVVAVVVVVVVAAAAEPIYKLSNFDFSNDSRASCDFASHKHSALCYAMSETGTDDDCASPM